MRRNFRGQCYVQAVLVATCIAIGLTCLPVQASAAETWHVGVGKVDITPTEPLRLSGYATRVESTIEVDDPLALRAMALTPGIEVAVEDAQTLILVSIDGIVVSNAMTIELSEWLSATYKIPRSQFALCSTHSHYAPAVDGALENIFRQPSTAEHAAATTRYTRRLVSSAKQAIEAAMAARQPAKLSIATTQAGFAVNRRVLSNGSWTGFGEQSDGPVDHRVRVFAAHGTDGKLLGAAFLYACHCTTMNPSLNRISADWAGLAASRLEALHPQAVFLPVIGCGADANPNPRGEYQYAQQHAAELVTAIDKQLRAPQQFEPLSEAAVAHFGYAGLAPEQPTNERIEELLQAERSNDVRWAQHMQQVKRDMGRLPETYPMPIHTWRFGDQLAWVFLGGEVVIDYQYLLEKELPTEQTWVAAYTDDVFAYVASERMRSEGGYEVDSSMIYYLQPGRWQAGTQSLIARRVREVFDEPQAVEQPLSAMEALQAIRVPDGFQCELVAAEPLVQDPINLSFGSDGRVWVVEMADYPLGNKQGGRIKWLRDTDGDGSLDQVQLFLDGLSFPTSVMAWEDGALVIAAPDIFFAADRDGDGRAEYREVLLSGVDEANPQHRASGFEIGLDGWLHFAAGDGTEQLLSHRNGQTYSVHGRDVAWNPTSGEVLTTSGETQFVRARDEFGNWFGNSNSYPMYQYVIEDRYQDKRSVLGGVKQHLLLPAAAPPVLPRSRTLDRFNDLFAFNRFTSACSSIVVRVPGFETQTGPVGLVCEPVHNLVARLQLTTAGSTYAAERHAEDTTYDFFTSTDTWSRPVRVVNAPDGSVWIVDMVRQVIEHPQWIPTAWQARLNLRGGEALGRIYRVYHRDAPPQQAWALKPPATDRANATDPIDAAKILEAIHSDIGARRDLALQALMDSGLNGAEGERVASALREFSRQHSSPAVRAAALGGLAAKQWLNSDDVISALQDADPRVVRWGLELSERLTQSSDPLCSAMAAVVERNLGGAVDLQWVLTAPRHPGCAALPGLEQIASRRTNDAWILRALSLLKDDQQALAVGQQLLSAHARTAPMSPQEFSQLEQCLLQLWSDLPTNLLILQARKLSSRTLPADEDGDLDGPSLLRLSVLAQLVSSRNDAERSPDRKELQQLLSQVSQTVLKRLRSGQAAESQQVVLVNLLGCGLANPSEELQLADELLGNARSSEVLKRTTVETLRRLRSDEVADTLLRHWVNASGQVRAAIGATLLTREAWTIALVEALESGQLARRELDLTTEQNLRNHRNRIVRNRCVELFGRPTERTAVVASYLSEMPVRRESFDGERLFSEHCAACHRAAQDKPQLGPSLDNLGHWTLDQWVTAIMDPNQAVEPKYRQTALQTADGLVLSGVVLERNSATLQLAAGDGSVKVVAIDAIETERDSGISLMPEGFEEKLTPEQLSDLLAYLRAGRQP